MSDIIDLFLAVVAPQLPPYPVSVADLTYGQQRSQNQLRTYKVFTTPGTGN